jgi:glycosyltransferase involved in cell wall biosynthesis
MISGTMISKSEIEHSNGNLLIPCIVDGPPSKIHRGPQIYFKHLFTWLSKNQYRGSSIFGSRRRIVEELDISELDDFKLLYSSKEKTYYFGIPSMIRSLFYIVFSSLQIIRNNREYYFSFILSQDASFAGLSALFSSRIIGIPLILTMHGINKNALLLLNNKSDPIPFGNKIKSKIFYSVNRFLLKKSDLVLCIGTQTADLIPDVNKYSMSSTIDVSFFNSNIHDNMELRYSLGLSDDDIVFGYIGSLTQEKRIDEILRALERLQRNADLSRLKFLIVGDGDEFESLKNLTNNLGLMDIVYYTGFCEDVRQFLELIDVFIIFSETEGMPLSVLEAMASGKAIIGSNIPGVSDLITDREEGLLVSIESTDELENAIVELYYNNTLRSILGVNAREKAKFFDVNVVFPSMFDEIRKYVME